MSIGTTSKTAQVTFQTSRQATRQEWIDACDFHPMKNEEVLGRVYDEIEKNLKAALRPVLLLDLDSTLYHVEARSHQILKEWLDDPESRKFGPLREKIAELRPDHIGYSLQDTFKKMGLSLEDELTKEVLGSCQKFWRRRFFTNEYLAYDLAYPGTPEFVQKAHALGAEIAYLTGRDEPGMGKGTYARLASDHFPIHEPRTRLILKKNFELDDLEHKSKAAEALREIGNLVASFENEPPNLIALSDLFPEAMHVFVDTVYSERPALPKSGLYRITGFQ